jgi:4,5-dihydroxyphthalate decarboxylase
VSAHINGDLPVRSRAGSRPPTGAASPSWAGVVALRRELVDACPWLPYETLRAFRASKDRALAEVQDPRKASLAWANDAWEKQVALMGTDPWAYDVEGSRQAIPTLVRYAVEQGIATKAPAPEDLFHPAAMDEPPGYVRR